MEIELHNNLVKSYEKVTHNAKMLNDRDSFTAEVKTNRVLYHYRVLCHQRFSSIITELPCLAECCDLNLSKEDKKLLEFACRTLRNNYFRMSSYMDDFLSIPKDWHFTAFEYVEIYLCATTEKFHFKKSEEREKFGCSFTPFRSFVDMSNGDKNTFLSLVIAYKKMPFYDFYLEELEENLNYTDSRGKGYERITSVLERDFDGSIPLDLWLKVNFDMKLSTNQSTIKEISVLMFVVDLLKNTPVFDVLEKP